MPLIYSCKKLILVVQFFYAGGAENLGKFK